jgi:uncharacterized delta-60 repeat protein
MATVAAPGDIDPTFVSDIRATSSVNATVILPDHTMFVGGYFGNDLAQKAIAKIRADGTLDASFSPRFTIPSGYGGADVNRIAMDRSDRLLIVGHFTHVNGVTRNGFARIDQAGALDHSFDPVINDEIKCLEIQPDGKILIGGDFTSVGGLRRPFLARLNEDGSVDSGFAPLSGAGSPVTTVRILADGKIIAGGSNFITAAGTSRKGLIRLLSNGELDADFNPPLSAGRTDALALQQDGKVIAGGYFTAIAPAVQTEVLRFNADGGVDGGFLPNMEMTGYTDGMYTVQSLATQADGKILIGGGFNRINGTDRRFLARLNPNGSIDETFVSNASSWVHMIARQNNGDMLVSQNHGLLVQPFTNFFRLSNPSVDSLTFPSATSVRWNRGGAGAAITGVLFSIHENGVWQSLGNGAPIAGGWELDGITLPANGVLRARPVSVCHRMLEQFATLGNPAPAFELTDTDDVAVAGNQLIDFGGTWIGASNELRFTIRNTGNAILQPLTLSLAGPHPGDFRIAGVSQVPLAPGGRHDIVVRFTPQATGQRFADLQFIGNQAGLPSLGVALRGTTVTTINPAFSGAADPPVAIAEGFSAAGKSVGSISLDFKPPLHTGFTLVNNLIVQNTASSLPNPSFPINGTFDDLPDQSIIHLTFDGHNYPFLVNYAGGDGNDLTLTLLGEGTPDAGFAVEIAGATSSVKSWTCSEHLPDGRFLVAGSFTSINGTSRGGIARLNADGTLDPTFHFRGGVAATAIALLPDGKVLVAGKFENESTAGAIALARLNPDGTIDEFLVQAINATVTSLIIRPDRKILMLGNFTSMGGIARSRVALLEMDGTVDASYNPSASGAVIGGSLLPDGKILLRGSFTGIGSAIQKHLARLNPDGSLDESFNPVFKAQGTNSTPSILASLVQPDGKVVIGGSFVEIDGVFRDNIVRLNPDGSVDEGFVGQADGEVSDLYLLQNGKLFASGRFDAAGGIRTSNVARFNPDGTTDPSFIAKSAPQHALSGVTRAGTLLMRNGTSLLGKPAASSLEIRPGGEVVWLRSDALGELGPPRFESRAAGGAGWVDLGPPSKVADGWHILSQGLPDPGAVRAVGRGRSAGESLAADESHVSLGTDPAAVIIRNPAGDTIGNGGFADFGSTIPIDPRTLTLTIENTSSAAISGLNASISGTNSADFILEGLSGDRIPPFGSITARIRFQAQAPGLKTATLQVATVPGGTIGQADLRGDIGSGFSPVIQGYSDSPVTPADFNAALYTLQTFQLGFQPVSGRTITLLRSPGTSLGAFSNAPEGSVVLGIYQGRDFRFRISYATLGIYKTAVLTYLPYGTADPTFNAALNASSGGALAIQPDGGILFSGAFTQAGGQPHQRIARMNPDGSVDHRFKTSANALIECIATQADGRIMVAGSFTLINGANRRGIARLNPDGSLDASFDAGLNNSASRVVVLPGGASYVTGPFTSAGGIARTGIARLLADGRVDGTFDAGLLPGPPLAPNAILVQADGKILLGGVYSLPDTSTAYLTRFLPNGSVDVHFNPAINGIVSAMAFERSGKLVIGGQFTAVSNQVRGRIARLNGDGSVDSSFSAMNFANGTVACIAVQANGGIVASGQFSTIGGQARPAVARLTSGGTVDNAFIPAGASSFIRSVALTDSGQTIVCGDFSSFGGLTRSALAKLAVEDGGGNLEVAADHLQWNRRGTSAELDSAAFSFSTDGEIWSPLGQGVRNARGWELTGIPMPTGFIRAEGRHSVSNNSSGLARNTRLSGREMTAMETWRETWFGSALSEGPGADSADPDHDRVNNLLEYAFGLSPVDNTSRLLPSWVPKGSYHEITFEKPTTVDGLDYSGEWSSTLDKNDWHPAEDVSSGGWLKYRVPAGEKPEIFMRLKVSRP